MRGLKALVITVGLLIALAVGFFFFKGFQPEIIVSAEKLWHFGPINITNGMLTGLFSALITCLFMWLGARRTALVPRGAQNFVEAVFEWMLGIVEDVAGKNGRRFFPAIASIFLFILISNWLGLLPIYNAIGVTENKYVEVKEKLEADPNAPYTLGKFDAVIVDRSSLATIGSKPPHVIVELPAGLTNEQALEQIAAAVEEKTHGDPSKVPATLIPLFRSTNSDVNMPLAIAFWSFIFVEYWGLSTLGLGYLKKFFNPSALLHFRVIDLFVGVLEFLSELIRIVSFTFRLFGNIFAGEVLLLFMTFLVPFLAPTVFYGLELFVGFIQAAVFALLTLVFAVMAVESHAEEGHGEAEAAAHGTHA